MDDDDFGGFEAAETFDSQPPVSPAIPWAAFSSVPGLSAPPDILLDQHPTFQADSLEPGPLGTPPEQHQAHLGDDTPAVTQSVEATRPPSPPGGPEAHTQLREALSSLRAKLTASEEEKARIQQDLEELMEKQASLEERLETGKRADAEFHKSRYAELQEKHNRGLEDLRKAGHESLAIIVEEFKALTKAAVLQQQEAGDKCLEAALEKQREKCEELLTAQHQRLLDLLDAEREALEEKLKESLSQQAQHQKELLEKCLQGEQLRAREAVEAAIKTQEAQMKEAVLEAVKEERRQAEGRLAEQRAELEAERDRDRDALAQAIQDALADQRRISKEVVKEAVAEERRAGQERLEEATLKVREELQGYMKEQRRLDQLTRQRNLASLELFLSCAQRQLSGLMQDGPVDAEGNPDAL